jgi:hypothetical protein
MKGSPAIASTILGRMRDREMELAFAAALFGQLALARFALFRGRHKCCRLSARGWCVQEVNPRARACRRPPLFAVPISAVWEPIRERT